MSATATRPLRALLVPAISTAVMLAILLGLGFWQVQRLHWKLGILAEIDRAEAAPPVPLPVPPLGQPRQFTKVAASGTFRPGLHALYAEDVRGTTLGSDWLEVLDRPGQDPLLVDRGWVPEGQTPPPGTSPATGYIRTPSQAGLFTPAPDPATRHVFALDPAAIAPLLGLSRVAPYTLVAMGPPQGVLQPATDLPRPPNNHLQYAITWFALAATLLAVFAAYCRKTLR